MCLLVVIPAQWAGSMETLRRHLATGAKGNPHGLGYAFAAGGRVEIVKDERHGLEAHLAGLESDLGRFNADSAFIVHYRQATSGKVDYENTHPFRVLSEVDGSEYALAHNGIIRGLGDKRHSDTWHLARKLETLPAGWSQCPFIGEMLAEYVGEWNKLAIIDQAGEVCIINEGEGVVVDGVWFSNTGYKDTRDMGWGGRGRYAQGGDMVLTGAGSKGSGEEERFAELYPGEKHQGLHPEELLDCVECWQAWPAKALDPLGMCPFCVVGEGGEVELTDPPKGREAFCDYCGSYCTVGAVVQGADLCGECVELLAEGRA